MFQLDFQTAAIIDGTDRVRFIGIYGESFPREERDEPHRLLGSIASGKRHCDLVYVGGELVGFAVVLGLSAHNIQFLEYFAVDSRHRNRGIGTRFLKHLTDRLRLQKQSIPGVVFEVERPDPAAAEAHRLRQRRIDFYTRNGAVLVECALAYKAPNLAGEGTIPYLLMWLPLDPAVNRLDGKLLQECVVAVLTESYGLNAGDTVVTDAVAKLTC
jgi:GNAT superfamily N-acetyltransferase